MENSEIRKKDGVDLFAAMMMFLFSIIGIGSNTFMLYIFYIDKQERTSFNVICIARAISNIYILSTTFVSVFFVITVIGHSPYVPEYETINIGISITCYILNEYLSCYVALNRFIAMFFPNYYPKIFSIKITLTVVVLTYTIGIADYLYEVQETLALNCFSWFDTQILAFNDTALSECIAHRAGLVIIFFICLFLSVTVVNLATLAKILMFYNKVADFSQLNDIPTRMKMKKNIILFTQTIFQDLLYLIDIWFTFQLSFLSKNRIWTFLSRTFVWLSIHTLDGIIMMIFSERASVFQAYFNSSVGP